MLRRIAPALIALLMMLWATPHATADQNTNQPLPNGEDIPAVFTTWARVLRPSWTYDAPNGRPLRTLDDWDTWLSVKSSTVVNGVRWYRLHNGTWVNASDVRFMPVTQFEGYHFQGDEQGNLGFVIENDTWVLQQPNPNSTYLGSLSRYTPVGLFDGANGYYRIADGQYIWGEFVRPVKFIQRPAQVGADEKWIDVNLTQQTVVAYEGDTPVFATLTSSGKGKTPTAKGLFRIYEKHVSHTMAGGQPTTDEAKAKPKGDDLNDPYSLDEVPWSMYFYQRYALHGAYWHDVFGQTRSHGCVNLSPSDSKFLFTWSGPVVPPGANSVWATADNPGTWVWVHD